jgi:mannosyl-3-phosphoglycerate phosphatase
VGLLIERFARQGQAVASAALGDGFNDLPMLQAVDHAFLVRRADGRFAFRVDFPGLTRTRGAGPVGWNEAVMALLDELGWAGIESVAGGKGK